MELAIVFDICPKICSELYLQKSKFINIRRNKRKFTGNKFTSETNSMYNPIENKQESMEQREESENRDVTPAKETMRQFFRSCRS